MSDGENGFWSSARVAGEVPVSAGQTGPIRNGREVGGEEGRRDGDRDGKENPENKRVAPPDTDVTNGEGPVQKIFFKPRRVTGAGIERVIGMKDLEQKYRDAQKK